MNKRSIHLPFVLTIAVATLLTLTCRVSPFGLLQSKTNGLQLGEIAVDGEVSGSFRYSREQGNETVQFSVSADGLAGFWVEGASEDNILTVDVRQKESARMNWKGEQLDGYGALSTEEKAALDDLLLSNLAYGLAMIPLDIACQEDGLVDTAQVAALLYPLQLRFKYQVTDRAETAGVFGSLSQCTYGENESDTNQNTSMIIMMPSSPVPVVLGYFPFDPEGAAEISTTTSSDVKLASLNISLSDKAIDNTPKLILPGSNPFGLEPIRDEWGPCKAKCRGACGSDCTTSNCTLSIEDRCEKNQDGENDGFKSIVYTYDCGLHPACIEHDACYDDCNSYYGCNTFAAAFCRHSETFASAPFEYFTESYISCDSAVLIEEGIVNATSWMRGFGPQTTRQVFEYSDPVYSYEYDLVSCPLEGTSEEGDPVIPPDEEKDPPTSSESEEAPVIENDPPEEAIVSSIPVGTYKGTIEFTDGMLAYAESYSSEVIIVVANDGTVTGSFTGQIIDKPYSYDYTYQWTADLSGVFSGTLTDSKGEIRSSEVINFTADTDDPYVIGTPSGSFERKVDIEISGNELTGVTGIRPDFTDAMFNLIFNAEKTN